MEIITKEMTNAFTGNQIYGTPTQDEVQEYLAKHRALNLVHEAQATQVEPLTDLEISLLTQVAHYQQLVERLNAEHAREQLGWQISYDTAVLDLNSKIDWAQIHKDTYPDQEEDNQ